MSGCHHRHHRIAGDSIIFISPNEPCHACMCGLCVTIRSHPFSSGISNKRDLDKKKCTGNDLGIRSNQWTAIHAIHLSVVCDVAPFFGCRQTFLEINENNGCVLNAMSSISNTTTQRTVVRPQSSKHKQNTFPPIWFLMFFFVLFLRWSVVLQTRHRYDGKEHLNVKQMCGHGFWAIWPFADAIRFEVLIRFLERFRIANAVLMRPFIICPVGMMMLLDRE